MLSKITLPLILSMSVAIGYTVAGCGDDDDAQSTCEAGCNRILRCAEEFGIDPNEFTVDACITDCRSEDTEKITCAGGCDTAPNCVAYAACLGGCGVSFDED